MKKSDAELLAMFRAEHGDLLDEYERSREECLRRLDELVLTMTEWLSVHDRPSGERLN